MEDRIITVARLDLCVAADIFNRIVFIAAVDRDAGGNVEGSAVDVERRIFAFIRDVR